MGAGKFGDSFNILMSKTIVVVNYLAQREVQNLKLLNLCPFTSMHDAIKHVMQLTSHESVSSTHPLSLSLAKSQTMNHFSKVLTDQKGEYKQVAEIPYQARV